MFMTIARVSCNITRFSFMIAWVVFCVLCISSNLARTSTAPTVAVASTLRLVNLGSGAKMRTYEWRAIHELCFSQLRYACETLPELYLNWIDTQTIDCRLKQRELKLPLLTAERLQFLHSLLRIVGCIYIKGISNVLGFMESVRS